MFQKLSFGLIFIWILPVLVSSCRKEVVLGESAQVNIEDEAVSKLPDDFQKVKITYYNHDKGKYCDMVVDPSKFPDIVKWIDTYAFPLPTANKLGNVRPKGGIYIYAKQNERHAKPIARCVPTAR